MSGLECVIFREPMPLSFAKAVELTPGEPHLVGRAHAWFPQGGGLTQGWICTLVRLPGSPGRGLGLPHKPSLTPRHNCALDEGLEGSEFQVSLCRCLERTCSLLRGWELRASTAELIWSSCFNGKTD